MSYPSRKIARAKAILLERLKKAQREALEGRKAADDVIGVGLVKREKSDSESEQH
jgi:hypothetical protein